jgi:protein-S-isoprenylcysteine O-methyltransferase Ste14
LTKRESQMTEQPPSRGMGWVYAQIPLLALALTWPVAQHMLGVLDAWPSALVWPARVLGAIAVAGAVLLFRAARAVLGPDLVAVPAPRPDGVLRTVGVYASVRHPIYVAIMLGVAGWALLWTSEGGLVVALACCTFFSLKTVHEERYLRARYPDYEAYADRVPRFIPRRAR